MLSSADLFALTARLRRNFPRHAEVLALCDEAERLSHASVTNGVTSHVTNVTSQNGYVTKPRRDRSAYMREYRSRPKG